MAPAARRQDSCAPVRSIVLLAIVWLVWAPRAGTQPLGFREPEVKAVFLFNFAQFVEWPAGAFADPRSAFVIGILGDDPFGHLLDDVVKGEVVNGRTMVIVRFRRVEDIRACHILFVGQFDAQQYDHIFETLERRPILTVGDTEGFAAGGGAIRFVNDQKRIRLRVNVDATSAANLTISSNLLRSAEIVNAGRSR